MSYALDFDDLDDISLSLAYFADTHLPLGHLDCSCGTIADPYKILKNMRQDTHLSALPNIQKSVTEKMKYIAAFPSFRNHVQSIHLHSDPLVDIALFALRLYITSPSIITLHCITATHALRLAKPSIVNFEEAIAYLWQAICTLYIVVGLPSIKNERDTTEEQMTESEWGQWKKKVLLSNNVHLIKLFYTCLEEKKIYGFSEYEKATRIILDSE